MKYNEENITCNANVHVHGQICFKWIVSEQVQVSLDK